MPASRPDPADFSRLLLESITELAIFGLEPNWTIRACNVGCGKLTGYSSQEVLGRSLALFFPAEEPALLATAFDQAARQGHHEAELWGARKDGTKFWAHLAINPIQGPGGELLGYAAVTRDATARRRAEDALRQSEERLRLMVESVKDYAIFMLDEGGRVQSWNLGAERIKGYRPEEVLGEHIRRFYTPEDAAAGLPERVLREAEEVGRVEIEGWRVRKDGTRFWADAVVTAVRDFGGKLRGFAKVTRDLTERREAEDKRLRLAQVQEAVRLRDEFLAIAAHELRTPLTALQLQLQTVRDAVETSEGRARAKVESALRSTTRLADLVETLLDVSVIAEGRLGLQRSTVDLVEVVREVVEHLGSAAKAAGSEVRLKLEPVSGSWDRMRLEQVVTNLLSNALKYGAGTPVELEVFRRGTKAVFQVTDGGPGIPAAHADRLFLRFERASPVENYGGLGLGLYITKEIVNAHGGTVTAANAPGKGARFVVELPL